MQRMPEYYYQRGKQVSPVACISRSLSLSLSRDGIGLPGGFAGYCFLAAFQILAAHLRRGSGRSDEVAR
jgi:hypothetical protein